jgi:hypothetical protein
MSSNNSSLNKFRQKFLGFDVFGEQVKLTYQGKWKYQTVFGAALTIILFMILAVYASWNLASVVGFSLVKLHTHDMWMNMTKEELNLTNVF